MYGVVKKTATDIVTWRFFTRILFRLFGRGGGFGGGRGGGRGGFGGNRGGRGGFGGGRPDPSVISANKGSIQSFQGKRELFD